MFENCETCLSQFLRAQGGIFRSLVLFDQQSKTQRYSIYNDIKQRKQQIFTFNELEPANSGHLCLKSNKNNSLNCQSNHSVSHVLSPHNDPSYAQLNETLY